MPCARMPLGPKSAWIGVYLCDSNGFFGACAQQAGTLDTSSAVAIDDLAMQVNSVD